MTQIWRSGAAFLAGSLIHPLAHSSITAFLQGDAWKNTVAFQETWAAASLAASHSLDGGGFALLNPYIGDELLGPHPDSNLGGACWAIGSPVAAEVLLDGGRAPGGGG